VRLGLFRELERVRWRAGGGPWPCVVTQSLNSGSVIDSADDVASSVEKVTAACALVMDGWGITIQVP
jgi:hypothetical protein